MKSTIHFPKKRGVGILLTILFFIVILSFILPFNTLLAQVMQSATYEILSDSVNIGGREDSSSTNYMLLDTVGEAGTGDSNSAIYYMRAGYRQMLESYIAITSPSDLVLSPIGGITGESSEGTLSWQVTTDNTAGYTMSIETATTPALKSAFDSFADYVPVGADPDYNFSITSTTSAFGFSPEGSETNARFKDNGSVCNTGSGEVVAKCWDGLSVSSKTIAGSINSNHPAGNAVNVRFRAESGVAHIQPSGTYSASIVVTALTL